MSTRKNSIGTSEESSENQKLSKKELILTLVGRRDVLLAIGGLAAAHLLGLIQIPLVGQIPDFGYGDIILSSIIGSTVAYALVWPRLKRLLNKIYNKNWVYVILTDALGDVTGVWKTDPETFDNGNDKVEFEDADQPLEYREGVDKAGRRYLLVNDIRKSTKEDVEWELTNIDTYPANISEDMVIASKEHLSVIMDNLQEQAAFGRKAKLSLKSRMKSIVNKISAQMVVLHENATSDGTPHPEDIWDDSIEGYEKLEIETDDLGKEMSEDIAEQAKQEIVQQVQNQPDPSQVNNPNNQGDSQ